MKRTIAILFSLACVSGFTGGVTAQVSGPPIQVPGAQTMHDKNMPDETSVIGCVAQSADMTRFMLNNVKDADSKANAAVKNEATMKKHDGTPMSYMLMSVDDLKSHVGHQVEVTGTIVSTTSGVIHGELKGQMPQDVIRQDPAAAKSDVPTFAVKSVKMISNACS